MINWSNFNLRSPNAYLVLSYLIATVVFGRSRIKNWWKKFFFDECKLLKFSFPYIHVFFPIQLFSFSLSDIIGKTEIWKIVDCTYFALVLSTLKVYRDEHDKSCRQCVKYKNAAFGKWARFKIIKKYFQIRFLSTVYSKHL